MPNTKVFKSRVFGGRNTCIIERETRVNCLPEVTVEVGRRLAEPMLLMLLQRILHVSRKQAPDRRGRQLNINYLILFIYIIYTYVYMYSV